MKKRKTKLFTVMFLAFLLVFPLFIPAEVQAAGSSFPGMSISQGETVHAEAECKFIKDGVDKWYKDFRFYDITLISGSDVHLLGFNYVDGVPGETGTRGGYSILIYSDKPFEYKLKGTEKTEYYDGEIRYGIEQNPSFEITRPNDYGLYVHTMGAYSSWDETSLHGVPAYNINFSNGFDSIYQSIADGTFEDDYRDNFIEGSEYPEFDPESAEYVKDIGYLQGIRQNIYIACDADAVSAEFKEMKTKVIWDSLTNTGFDVTSDNVYVSFYNQVLGYKQNLPFGDKQQVEGSKVFINRVKGSDLSMIFYNTDIRTKCAEDLAKFEYTPLLQTVSMNYAEWFRVEVYDSSAGSWKYGGWVRLYEKGDGNQSTTTTTWIPDEDGGNDDIKDPDGGVGDGEITPGEAGAGDTLEDAENNANELDTTPDYSFSNFDDILSALAEGIGNFPKLLGQVFSFLPGSFTGMLVAGLAVIIVCRILGR